MKALIAEAARLDVRVHLAYLDSGILGFYDHQNRVAYVDLRLSPDEMCDVLAHELGHAWCGHGCLGNAADELAADRRAALLLVDPDLYADAERVHPHPSAIAELLNLSVHIVTVWRDWWLPKILARRFSA